MFTLILLVSSWFPRQYLTSKRHCKIPFLLSANIVVSTAVIRVRRRKKSFQHCWCPYWSYFGSLVSASMLILAGVVIFPSESRLRSIPVVLSAMKLIFWSSLYSYYLVPRLGCIGETKYFLFWYFAIGIRSAGSGWDNLSVRKNLTCTSLWWLSWPCHWPLYLRHPSYSWWSVRGKLVRSVSHT